MSDLLRELRLRQTLDNDWVYGMAADEIESLRSRLAGAEALLREADKTLRLDDPWRDGDVIRLLARIDAHLSREQP